MRANIRLSDCIFWVGLMSPLLGFFISDPINRSRLLFGSIITLLLAIAVQRHGR